MGGKTKRVGVVKDWRVRGGVELKTKKGRWCVCGGVKDKEWGEFKTGEREVG